MSIGITEFVALAVVVVLFWVPWGLGIWAIVHAARTPDFAWNAVGSSRVTWIVGILVATYLLPVATFFPVTPFFSFVGFVLSFAYLVDIRRKLNRAVALAGRESADRESTVS